MTDPEFSKQLHEKSTSTDKTLRLVPGAKHGDCFYKERMYDEVGVWIGKQVGSQRAYANKEIPDEDQKVNLTPMVLISRHLDNHYQRATNTRVCVQQGGL